MSLDSRACAVFVQSVSAQLLDVRAVALRLACSTRHVYRLADGGAMPAPIRLGASVRWSSNDLESWINGGCHPVKRAKTKRTM